MNPVLELRDLKFSWIKNGPEILDIDTLIISKGEKVFLEGPSGTGKSTLLNLIGGVLTPGQGSIKFLGEDLSQMKADQKDSIRGDRMGFIFQMFNLLPYFSPTENVMLPCKFSKRKMENVQGKATTLEEESNRLLRELGLDTETIASKSVLELSVGQQQRVAAARALIGGPDLIIADEPTSALDTDARENFLKLIFDECNKTGASLIFVSHDKSLGKLFDRTIALSGINRAYKGDVK